MKTGVIGCLNTKNIGDYIQTLSVIKLIDSDYKILDRESLDVYQEKPRKIIINGWFMENPTNFPPSDNLNPLFISFHVSPSAANKMLTNKTINYLKQHQPIGCRDEYTQTLLEKYQLKTFLSSCVTLTLNKQDFINSSYRENRALIIGAFDRLKPNIETNKGFYKMLISVVKSPYKLLNYQTKTLLFNRWLKKQNLKLDFANQIVKNKISSHTEGIKLAEEVLQKIANSDYVITSRIHSALPAVAMGKKVIFINEGLDNINHSARLVGLESFFTSIKLKEIRMLNFDSIKTDMSHKIYSKKITEIIKAFLNK
jgi:hypothetical protein